MLPATQIYSEDYNHSHYIDEKTETPNSLLKVTELSLVEPGLELGFFDVSSPVLSPRSPLVNALPSWPAWNISWGSPSKMSLSHNPHGSKFWAGFKSDVTWLLVNCQRADLKRKIQFSLRLRRTCFSFYFLQ